MIYKKSFILLSTLFCSINSCEKQPTTPLNEHMGQLDECTVFLLREIDKLYSNNGSLSHALQDDMSALQAFLQTGQALQKKYGALHSLLEAKAAHEQKLATQPK